jgi:hypothetical protein
MKNRKAFSFYRSYYDVIIAIDDTEKLKLLMAILDKQFLDIEPDLDGITGLLYKGMKHSIDRQVEGFKAQTKKNVP